MAKKVPEAVCSNEFGGNVSRGEIIKAALELMKIDYDNWNCCLENCPSIRGDRYKLKYYVRIIEEQLKGEE